jgi:hypothetical protein
MKPTALLASRPDTSLHMGTSLMDIGWSMEFWFGPGPLPLAYMCAEGMIRMRDWLSHFNNTAQQIRVFDLLPQPLRRYGQDSDREAFISYLTSYYGEKIFFKCMCCCLP